MTKLNEKPNEKILYIGDNLPIMLGMESGIVDLIYTDPPFKTETFRKGKTEAHSFIDTWSNKQVDYAHAIALKFQYPNIWDLIVMAGKMHSPAMQHYLEFMAPRIVQMRRLLKRTGSLYLHCDPTASHYLKLILDNVFGKKKYRNEIIWAYSGTGKPKRKYKSKSDTIFFYTKSKNYVFNVQTEKYTNPSTIKRFDKIDGNGNRYKIWNTRGIKRKVYMQEQPLTNVWNLNIIGATSSERTGYATQKPIALLNRIIKASSNEGDLILDPFCGCATACVAATNLNRGWIGIDQNDEAPQILSSRLGGVVFTANYQTNMPAKSKADRQKAIKLPQRQVTGYKKLSKAKGKLNLLQVHYRKGESAFCKGCMRELDGKDLTVDHILAQDKGGLDELENYQLLCTSCNSSKGNNDMEFLYRRIDAATHQKRLEIEERRGNYE